nr:uncharacterized protein LOC101411639 [Dasypus novemcinctus]
MPSSSARPWPGPASRTTCCPQKEEFGFACGICKRIMEKLVDLVGPEPNQASVSQAASRVCSKVGPLKNAMPEDPGEVSSAHLQGYLGRQNRQGHLCGPEDVQTSCSRGLQDLASPQAPAGLATAGSSLLQPGRQPGPQGDTRSPPRVDGGAWPPEQLRRRR